MTTDATQLTDQVRALFDRCLDLDPAARAALLAGVPDATLRAHVEDLLRALDAPVPIIDTLLEHAAPLADSAPQRIGRYRVLREVGRGGMGTVYLAEQDEPRRRVAVKRIAGHLPAADVARFRREANLLAQLQHAGIAQIHEAGVDAAGTPFLAMEYVEGTTLREHARTLVRAERLALLARICDAVDHAHARGVVHRDLKPANILVRADGQPKILDFGIARSLGGDGDGLTETGMLLGTPAYMSPEQASGQHAPIDARSDVYALGVIGYELLTDRLPLSVAGLTPLQAMRLVAEETAPPLSRLDPTLRGDLEIIFAKALAKDPAQRYASAAALGDDIRRHLALEPIRARAPSVAYRALKFAQRKPALVAAIAVAVVALVGGVVVASWFALGERAERVRAQTALAAADAERERAESTLMFVTTLLAEANPARSGKPDVAVRDVLQRALPRVEALPPRAQGPLLLVLADAMAGYGAGMQALALYERATGLLREHGSAQADGANLRWVGTLLDVGRVHAARQALAPLLARRAVLAPLDALRVEAALGRIELFVGNHDAARTIREALERNPAEFPPGEVPPALQLAADEMRVHADFGRIDELVALHGRVAARARVLLGADHPFSLALGNFERFHHMVRLDDNAGIAAAVASYERHLAVLGAAHHATLAARLELADAYVQLGRFKEGFAQLDATGDAARRTLPSDSVFHVTVAGVDLAWRARSGMDPNLDAGVAVFEAHCRGGEDVPTACQLLATAIARANGLLGREQDALAWADAARRVLIARFGPNSPGEVWLLANVADTLARQGLTVSARRLADETRNVFATMQPTERRRVDNLRLLMASMFNRLGDFDAALPHAQHAFDRAFGGDNTGGMLPAPAARAYALALIGLGRYADAERTLVRAWDYEHSVSPILIDRADVARTFVKLYKAWGKPADADKWLTRLVAQIDAGAELTKRDRESWGWIEEYRARKH